MSDQKIKIGITLGDINGIGPEIIIKTFSDVRMSEMCTPVIYGSAKVLSFYKKTISGCEQFQYHTVGSVREIRAKRVNLIDCTSEEMQVQPGEQTDAAGQGARNFLDMACKDLQSGAIDVLVTGPINKENIQSGEFNFTGHTEYLASVFGGDPLMLMCSELMKVGLTTIHLPLSEVASAISKEKINQALIKLKNTLVQDFSIVEPKIAVLSLNPHAGDGGLLGKEEADIISPAILEAQNNAVLAFGPFAADGFFASNSYKKFDAVLAMYHDQGLAPFKALSPEGVNYTASLKIVRTSPDHGVAYDIAGQDKADPSSFREAIYMAMDVFRNRKIYKDISSNPLRRFEREKGADISVKDLIPEVEIGLD